MTTRVCFDCVERHCRPGYLTCDDCGGKRLPAGKSNDHLAEGITDVDDRE